MKRPLERSNNIALPTRVTTNLPLVASVLFSPLILPFWLILFANLRVSESLSLQFETLVNAQVDMERMSMDGMKAAKAKELRAMEGGGEEELAWDEVPLKETQGRVVSLNKETDAFAEVRRKRVNEYGKEVRESKIGM